MSIELHTSLQHADWNQVADLFAQAPLGTRSADSLEQVFRNSQVTVFAYDAERLVGAGRALTDRLAWAIVFDVAVHPDFQGQGVGTRILEAVCSASGARNMMLQSVPGKERFYSKLGFQPMTTAMAKYREPQWALENGYVRARENGDA